jgi:hypothetical protein
LDKFQRGEVREIPNNEISFLLWMEVSYFGSTWGQNRRYFFTGKG